MECKITGQDKRTITTLIDKLKCVYCNAADVRMSDITIMSSDKILTVEVDDAVHTVEFPDLNEHQNRNITFTLLSDALCLEHVMSLYMRKVEKDERVKDKIRSSMSGCGGPTSDSTWKEKYEALLKHHNSVSHIS